MSKAFGAIIGIPVLGAMGFVLALMPSAWGLPVSGAIGIGYLVWLWRLPNGPR